MHCLRMARSPRKGKLKPTDRKPLIEKNPLWVADQRTYRIKQSSYLKHAKWSKKMIREGNDQLKKDLELQKDRLVGVSDNLGHRKRVQILDEESYYYIESKEVIDQLYQETEKEMKKSTPKRRRKRSM